MLETTWFFLWGLLWAIYFMLDGYDLGMGTLMPFIAKNDFERRVIYNAAGPFWDGNEVWLITAGGVTFAAFPLAYAVMFSGMYTALLLLLFALIVRGVSFEFRSKVADPRWRKTWDYCQIIGSFLPALLLGVAFANIFQGLPIRPMQGTYVIEGGILALLNPYGLAGGVLFVILFCYHGALWLTIRATGELQTRATVYAKNLWLAELIAIVLFLVFSAFATPLFNNYLANPVLFLVLVVPVAGLICSKIAQLRKKWWAAWFASCFVIVGCTFFGLVGIFPALLPSSLDPMWSITATNAGVSAASSPLTLKIMLTVVLIFLPFILAYQFWVYKKFSHPIYAGDKLEY